jgi:hypothetical protein
MYSEDTDALSYWSTLYGLGSSTLAFYVAGRLRRALPHITLQLPRRSHDSGKVCS